MPQDTQMLTELQQPVDIVHISVDFMFRELILFGFGLRFGLTTSI
jgi:hypothetical protein